MTRRGKRPTRAQKILIAGAGLIPDNWLVCKTAEDGILIKHKHTNTLRRLPKGD